MHEELIRCFEIEMRNIYRRAYNETGYKATRFLQMLDKHKGYKTARILINSPTISEGYAALWELGRLDITIEAVIHDNPKWHPLFTKEEMEIIRKRLTEYNYTPAINR